MAEMKTLDEVIKNFEICRKARGNIRGCDGCTYADDADVACIMHNESDVLYYLQEYRETKKHLACLDAGEIRGEDTQVVNNPPLTWDELRQMEGKPVWIWLSPRIKNTPGSGRWEIIYKFNPIGGNKNLFEMEMESRSRFRRKYQGDLWQAYRKERNETGD